LQRVFLHETGQTVAHYVRELKLSMAAEALLSTRLRVLDVALDHGFGSEVSFSRAFKQQFGCSPLAYRKRGLRLGCARPWCGRRSPALPLPTWCRCA
jgi:AraC family transcriptional regulator